MWKEIEGFPNYRVSDNGEVFSLATNKLLKPYPANSLGHLRVDLYNNGVKAHKYVKDLVYEAFCDKGLIGCVVTMDDGDFTNCNADNLVRMSIRGYSRPTCVHEVPCKAFYKGVLQYECDTIAGMALVLGISRPSVYSMLKGLYTFRRAYVETVSDDILKLWYNGCIRDVDTYVNIKNKYHVSDKVVDKQLKKRNVFVRDWKVEFA